MPQVPQPGQGKARAQPRIRLASQPTLPRSPSTVPSRMYVTQSLCCSQKVCGTAGRARRRRAGAAADGVRISPVNQGQTVNHGHERRDRQPPPRGLPPPASSVRKQGHARTRTALTVTTDMWSVCSAPVAVQNPPQACAFVILTTAQCGRHGFYTPL